jgi:hypothetical protein
VDDIFQSEKLKLMLDVFSNDAPIALNEFFKLNSDIHNVDTRNSNMFRIPAIKTSRFGINSLYFTGPSLWNSFYKKFIFPNLINSKKKLKNHLNKFYIKLYKSQE